jgi:hypothetical protein
MLLRRFFVDIVICCATPTQIGAMFLLPFGHAIATAYS